MKFTLAAAALSTASAHGHCPFKAFFESLKPSCPNRDESKMLHHGAFWMKAHHTVTNSIVKGWYHDSRTEVIGEQCFGSWMHESAKPIHGFFHKVGEFFYDEGTLIRVFIFGHSKLFVDNQLYGHGAAH